MRMNRRGFAGLEIVAVLALGFLVTSVILPMVGINILPGAAGKQSTQKSVTTIVPATGPDGKPVYVKDAAGNVAPLMAQSIQTLDIETTPSLPWWKKLLNLGWIYLALCIAGLFFAPLGIVMGALNHKIGSEAENFIGHSKIIVKSVDAGLTEIEKAIAAAQTSYNTAQAAAAAATNLEVRLVNQGLMATQQAVINALTALDRDIKDAMTMVQGQGSATEAVVTSLQAPSK